MGGAFKKKKHAHSLSGENKHPMNKSLESWGRHSHILVCGCVTLLMLNVAYRSRYT